MSDEPDLPDEVDVTRGVDLHPVVLHHIVNGLGWSALRPLQSEAIAPIVRGEDSLLLAPTAGGKTEAAIFPLLTAMEQQTWRGLTVLYVCPLKALLNNLLPRLETYTGWVGRRTALWHGDVAQSSRQRILRTPPDILLTTPESLEAMLVSEKVDHGRFFATVRAVVVDEVHAFAGDDRGWHLLAVLERVSRIAGRPLQRLGLSATVGNPDELMQWLQGSGRGSRPGTVVAPHLVAPEAGALQVPGPADVELDYVGSVANAAKVISSLHLGEKRLVFCDSRRLVEELGAALRERGVTTFLSHASLSADERRSAEQAFAEARDCVIVSTSTLELGIDVGDLDRVIQIDSPATVASFLQRLGRTGRRAGGQRNALFLALSHESLLRAAGLLLLWSRGYVEPVTAPPEPRHIVAQQLLALCLQEHRIMRGEWDQQWGGLAPFDSSAAPILDHLVRSGFIDVDGEFLFIGPQAEAKFGHRHFSTMTAVFAAPPQFTVLAGRQEIGTCDPMLVTERAEGPRVLLLAGRSWKVTWTDWTRRRCYVEPADGGGKARWATPPGTGDHFDLVQAERDVVLGENPPIAISRRAADALTETREDLGDLARPRGTVIVRHGEDVRWWTWSGLRTNLTLAATLGPVVDASQRHDDFTIRLRSDVTREMWQMAKAEAGSSPRMPAVDERAVAGLKFNEALPQALAEQTLAARLESAATADRVLARTTAWLDSPRH